MTKTPALDPGRDAFVDLAAGERPVVVRTTATLDVETTPLAAYAALTGRAGDGVGDDDGSDDDGRAPYAFLLESAEKTASSDPDGAFQPESAATDRRARFSYVGYDPAAVVTVGPDGTAIDALSADAPVASMAVDTDGDVLDALRAALPDARLATPTDADRDRPHLDGGLVGFLAYDAIYDLWLEEVGCERPDSRTPDAQFVLTTKTVAFDHREGTVSVVFTPVLDDGDDAGATYDELAAEAARVREVLSDDPAVETGGFVRREETAGSRTAYEDRVRRAKAHVRDGDVYQVVVSRTRELTGAVDPLGLYESLRAIEPAPYMYLLEYGERTVVGASPETLVSVRGREVTANPIAGTCARGTSPVEDRRLAGELLADGKERAEHTMLVDLARNDVRRVAEPGSVRVEEFMTVRKYSRVQHIESTVTGRLAASRDAFDAVRAAFPAGTLSGAPKVRAMEVVDDLEDEPRGLYGGGVGYVSWTGDADVAIAIRTATLTDRGDDRRIAVRAGAGLVADSDPAAEYDETEAKLGGVLAALERIESPDELPEASG